ncbi:hypothetical protein [uncultured Microbulbifer sp.]|uniref:hypothetical protein n=1 Tax=uncultured Microbulbifer sp. TaxID=348147 RepID=UPI002606239D|nr:hypothetical protein [uncultured Microbulbifer sp.]
METAEVTDAQIQIGECCEEIEAQVISRLGLKPVPEYQSLSSIKNLQGRATGYARVYRGEVIEKAAFLTLNFMPGMCYFNVHLIPRACYRIPRFSFEGMLTPQGSQISMDLYPDMDIMLNLEYFRSHYKRAADTYTRARFDSSALVTEPSRMLHMRAFASPYMLLAYGVKEAQVAEFCGYAQAYLQDWMDLCSASQICSEGEVEDRIRRRELIMRTIIECDPDREKVVMLYGEAVTEQIEQATML